MVSLSNELKYVDMNTGYLHVDDPAIVLEVAVRVARAALESNALVLFLVM